MKNTNKDTEMMRENGNIGTPVIPPKQLLTVDQDDVYTTVTSYPPQSLSNSVTSLQSLDQQANLEERTTSPLSHTFTVEKVQLPDEVVPRPRLIIPQISIEPEPFTPVHDYTPSDYSYSNQSTIHSGILTNGIDQFPHRISPPRSPPFERRIPVPNNHMNMIRRSFTEESLESGTESEDGNSPAISNGIEDIIAQPIDRNARKEGVISDKIDQKEVNVVNYQKSEE